MLSGSSGGRFQGRRLNFPHLSLYVGPMTSQLVVALSVALGLLILGGATTDTGPWYQSLKKPVFQPPGWAFAPAWTVILGLAAVASVLGWRGGGEEQRRILLLAFCLNAALHALWSPLFFKARRPDMALVEMGALFVSVLSLIVVLLPVTRLGALLILPYAAWVAFALAVNFEVVRLNRTNVEGERARALPPSAS